MGRCVCVPYFSTDKPHPPSRQIRLPLDKLHSPYFYTGQLIPPPPPPTPTPIKNGLRSQFSGNFIISWQKWCSDNG